MSSVDLKTELNRWYEEHCINGTQTWGTLANRSSVSVSQISKIASGQVGRTKYKTAKALIEALYPKDDAVIDQFLSENFPEIHQKTAYGDEPKDINLEQLRVLLKEQLTYRLVQLAGAKAYTEDDLHTQFGAGRVKRRLEVLSGLGVLAVGAYGIVSTTQAYQSIELEGLTSIGQDFHTAVDIVASKTQLSSYSSDSANDVANQLLPFSSNLSPQAVAQMAQEAREFMRAMKEKYSAPEHQGDIPVFLHLLSGRLDSK